MMDAADVSLRNLTYRMFVELGRAPTVAEVASGAGLQEHEAAAAWQRLHDAHALVLHPGTSELRMANPFSAQPTAYRVHAAGRDCFGRWRGSPRLEGGGA